ncbi:hypothetical protein HYALB_00011873 [Hymenoscyphus albidus]|uniref:NAD dependent epimerase/dehydratase n=1 Tax=Hymenoscyphus albidus TaxID=595503 RepID=A0A9N9LKM1_9HELO|nr:hypothetical protein HYALB_00011873 [Hymenoscyphus albidus]
MTSINMPPEKSSQARTRPMEVLVLGLCRTGTLFGISDVSHGLRAVTDVPCASFVPELITAYPDAKIILSTRDADGWVRSMEGTIVKKLTSTTTSPSTASEHSKNTITWSVESRRLRGFLEFEAKDGWGSLCEFLGKERPDEEFPRTNNVKEFGERSKAGARKVLGIAAVRAAKMLGGWLLALWFLLWVFGVVRR